jgi:hypothetical protein
MNYIRILILYLLLFTLSGCVSDVEYPVDEYDIEVTGIFNRDGSGYIPMDGNGYYRLLITNNGQQTHRVTGYISKNGNVPYPPERVEWESNMYFIIRRGDTITNQIVYNYINEFTGEFNTVQLPPLISPQDDIVPTVNPVSISDSRGYINIMIGVWSMMKGDTLLLRAEHTPSNTVKFVNVVLDE